LEERLRIVQKFTNLTDDEIALLKRGLFDSADRMIENVIGTMGMPLGIATNFLINGRDYLIPMVVEESSVVAAASHAAKLARPGGFSASADPPIMIGQIQLSDVDFEKVQKVVGEKREEIFALANSGDSSILRLGGGLKEIEVREAGKWVVVHLLIDVRDAMGANIVNTICERVAPSIATWTGGRTILRIISNLATKRICRASAVWKADTLAESFDWKFDPEEIVDNFLAAYELAVADPYRRATHNKGIMNGIDALMIATGNDWRAAEAGAHTYSWLMNRPLTRYSKTQSGDLFGEIELPLACGIVGGATKINPFSQICLKILGVRSAQELAQVAASVGLANNFAAMRALATEGIQAGHMKLHATNIAHMAGASGELLDKIAAQMIEEGNISVARAKELMKKFN
jgi:hydroxymethylglutaryl-CoA reductase